MDSFPLDDWQFWIVTIACGWSAWIIARPFLPRKSNTAGGGNGACPNCSAGIGASHKKPKKTSLTIEGRRA